MRRLIASLTIGSALLLPASAFAFNIYDYEQETKVAARLISGDLDQRLIELGSNKQTGEFFPVIAMTIKKGVVRYCAFFQRATGKSADKCSRTISVVAANGSFDF